MARPTFSILIPTSGRDSLIVQLASIVPQLIAGDELLLDRNDDGDFGNQARNRMMAKATGSHLIFQDDDDRMVPDAFEIIRKRVQFDPECVHVFKMRYRDNRILWTTPELKVGNVSTQMFVVPNAPNVLEEWGTRYEADFDFIRDTCEYFDPIWHSDVICQLGK